MNTLPVPAASVSPLRQRLIAEMSMRRFSMETQRNYLRDVGRLASFLGRSPDTASAEDLRRFQIALQKAGLGVPTMNAIVSALRFFFIQTIDRPDLARKLVHLRYPRSLPNVFSPDEVRRLLGATVCLKHLAALSVAYGAGLRASEVASLKVGDVDSTRMLLRVERGKGGRDRNAILSADLLALLREWWVEGHRQGILHREGWLFPGQSWDQPISTRQIHRVVVEAARAADIPKRVGPHTDRARKRTRNINGLTWLVREAGCRNTCSKVTAARRRGDHWPRMRIAIVQRSKVTREATCLTRLNGARAASCY
ncbi:site-specific integrase [Aurantimonas litoralis]|nr:site-specific integrase [Aurantimonas litoralis]